MVKLTGAQKLLLGIGIVGLLSVVSHTYLLPRLNDRQEYENARRLEYYELSGSVPMLDTDGNRVDLFYGLIPPPVESIGVYDPQETLDILGDFRYAFPEIHGVPGAPIIHRVTQPNPPVDIAPLDEEPEEDTNPEE